MANPIEKVQEQVNALASAHEEGIDTVASGIQDLYRVVDHLAEQLRSADLLIASMKFLLIKNKILNEQEILEMQSKMIQFSNKELEKHSPDPTKSTADNMQSELKVIHDAAKKAAETPYDADAFIFGS